MSRGTQVPSTPLFGFGYGAFTLCCQASQPVPLPTHGSLVKVLQPRMLESTRFGLFPFRSPLLWESLLISLPPGTEMFHFPGFASKSLCIQLKDDRI